ncbi:MAG: CDP-alcohol phosphatidyltransferase family protein [Bacteroidota bacterium]|nr:CDP-alcohol phosphatidyltransferase family protein [Bacteroidota bacterium]
MIRVQWGILCSCAMRFIPNAITIFRIVVTPLVIVFLFRETMWSHSLAFALFILGALSDFADGYIARALEMNSRLGRLLDPIADKVLVLGTFVALALLYPQQVPWWAVGIIALRDVLVTVLRMVAESSGRALRTIRTAKAKTALQLIFLGLFLLLLVLSHISSTAPLASELLGGWFMYGFMILLVAVTSLTGLLYFQPRNWVK